MFRSSLSLAKSNTFMSFSLQSSSLQTIENFHKCHMISRATYSPVDCPRSTPFHFFSSSQQGKQHWSVYRFCNNIPIEHRVKYWRRRIVKLIVQTPKARTVVRATPNKLRSKKSLRGARWREVFANYVINLLGMELRSEMKSRQYPCKFYESLYFVKAICLNSWLVVSSVFLLFFKTFNRYKNKYFPAASLHSHRQKFLVK